jgi:hypothetical protein
MFEALGSILSTAKKKKKMHKKWHGCKTRAERDFFFFGGTWA